MRKKAENQDALPVELERRIPELRDRLRQVEPTIDLPEDRRAMLYFELSRDIAGLAAPAVARGARTRLMNTLAERLACSRGLLYNLFNVGSMFTEGMLREQSWAWHVTAARWLKHFSEEDRPRALAELASRPREGSRRIPSLRSLRQEQTAWDEEAAEREHRYDSAERGCLLLDTAGRLRLLTAQLRRIGSPPGDMPAEFFAIALHDLLKEADRLRSLLPESTPPVTPAATAHHDHHRPPRT